MMLGVMIADFKLLPTIQRDSLRWSCHTKACFQNPLRWRLSYDTFTPELTLDESLHDYHGYLGHWHMKLTKLRANGGTAGTSVSSTDQRRVDTPCSWRIHPAGSGAEEEAIRTTPFVGQCCMRSLASKDMRSWQPQNWAIVERHQLDGSNVAESWDW